MLFNRGELVEGIARYLGIRAAAPFTVGDTIIPTVGLGDLTGLPYLPRDFGVPCMAFDSRALLAANHPYVLATPGPNVVLQLRQMWIHNTEGAAVSVSIRWLDGAELATLATPGSELRFHELCGDKVGRVRASFVKDYHHTAAIGTNLGYVRIPAGDMKVVEWPDPGVLLWGNDEEGRGGFGVVRDDAPATLLGVCTFVGREWPLPA